MQKTTGISVAACLVPRWIKSGLIIAEDGAMSTPFDESSVKARLAAQSSQEKTTLQQALLESVKLFRMDVLRFAFGWQTRKSETKHLGDIGTTLVGALDGLLAEFSRPEGPDESRVDASLETLIGKRDPPGPLAQLQRLTGDDPAARSLEQLRLSSETDTLFIQLNGLRAQWREYLALLKTAPPDHPKPPERSQPTLAPLPPNQKTYRSTRALPPLQHRSPPGQDDGGEKAPRPKEPFPPPGQAGPPASSGWTLPSGLMGLARGLLPVVLALAVILFVAYTLTSHLPQAGSHAPGSATSPAQLTSAAPTTQPTSAPTVIATVSPQPIVTPPPLPGQLSVSPATLLLPCPGTGGATLQLANVGGASLDWQVTISSASGGAAGILLDGAPSEQGQLAPGDIIQLSVTAQAQGAQGTLNVSYTGAPAPIAVPYSVAC
jgi:hypothetical protein